LSHFLYRLSYEARLSCNGVESEGPVLLMAGTEGLHDSVTEGGLALFRYVGRLTKWYSVPLLRALFKVELKRLPGPLLAVLLMDYMIGVEKARVRAALQRRLLVCSWVSGSSSY
jgi:hypothetical protein